MAITERAQLYRATVTPRTLVVPELTFVMVDGSGDPNTSQEYAEAIQALFSVSYTLHFALKNEHGAAPSVGPLEGLWWADDMRDFGASGSKDGWHWTAMIVQPDEVTAESFDAARIEAGRKRELPGLARARLERFDEGTCAQVLHVGPYSAEEPTIAALHAYILEMGGTFEGAAGKHHEIYLGDPRRSAPERLRTIIRQPYAPA